MFGLMTVSLIAGIFNPGNCPEALFDFSRKTNEGVL
jgi:hypothetical protein